jgi:hypothetical protein
MTAQSMSEETTLGTAPLAPTTLTAALIAGPKVELTWRDNATNEAGFVIERSTDGGVTFTQIGLAPIRNNTGNATYVDATVNTSAVNVTYTYRVAATNPVGVSDYSNSSTIAVPVVVPPPAPTNLAGSLVAGPQIKLTWRDNARVETGFLIERSTDGTTFTQVGTAPALSGIGTVTFNDTTIAPTAMNTIYTYRVAAVNGTSVSTFSNTTSVTLPALPTVPTNLTVVNGQNSNRNRSVILNWIDNSTNETGFTIQRATNAAFTQGLTTVTVGAGVTTLTQTGLARNTQYWFRIRANNGTIIYTAWVNATPFPIRTNP